ncbi:MAG: HAMP domain-containing protein [Deltaproteobacteria bacterium]|nr:HAMP domain-containing protein [Deltaproteobacteria bacterium]
MNPLRFLRKNLWGRIIFLVGLWMVALAGILLVSNHWGSEELSDRALNERRHLVQALVDNLDYLLKSNLVLLQEVALLARFGVERDAGQALRAALREAYLQSIFTEGVFLINRTGKMVWIEPQRPLRTDEEFSLLPPIRQVLEVGRPEVSNLIIDGKKRIFAVVPIRDSRGELSGAVGGELDPQNPRFHSLLHPIRLGDTTYLELVDGRGIVLASTKTGRAFIDSDHGRFLAGLIRDKKSVVGACHTCHEQKGFPEREREVIAFAPLKNAPWGLSIRQAEKEALAPSFAMERRFLLLGSSTILVALLFAGGVGGSVTKPVRTLTEAAKRIAKGDLDGPIPPLGEDEIGFLAQSLDQMRLTLKASLEIIAEGKRDLEQRVQERTRELEDLYREVQRKEEIRGELLKKVIGVQEEERKRIARELHDETSQDLAALLLSIETTAESAPEELKKKLTHMKAMADRTLDSIHRLILDLRPSVLDDLGLTSAIRWVAESRLEPLGIDLTFKVLGTERRLKPEIETTLFRIGQEAISNIARHAEANGVAIAIEFGDRHICLEVEDNGKGFDPKVTTDGSFGLLGMKERTTLFDGAFGVDSEPGKGTRLTIKIPVDGH